MTKSKKRQNEELTAEEKPDPAHQPKPTGSPVNVSGRLILDLPESEHHKEKRDRQQRTFLERVKRDLFRRLHKATFWLNLVGVLILFCYTKAAYQANQLTRQALTTTQRSHLGITNVQVTAYKPDEFRITFDLENQGNSASTDVRLDLWVTDWDTAKLCKRISVPKSVSFGNFPFQTGTVYHSSVGFDGFTNKQWTDVTIHGSFLKITGLLEYNDGFDTVREIGICFRYDGNWEVCPAANDAHLKNCK